MVMKYQRGLSQTKGALNTFLSKIYLKIYSFKTTLLLCHPNAQSRLSYDVVSEKADDVYLIADSDEINGVNVMKKFSERFFLLNDGKQTFVG